MKVISVINQKGGCGKSTTTVILGSIFGSLGYKTLIIDMDAQANATVSVGCNDEALTETVYDLLKAKPVAKKTDIDRIIVKTDYKNLDVLPSNITLSNAEIELSSAVSRETILSRIISQVKDDYDFVLIDCPPSLGLLSLNALVASDHVIIPVAPTFFSTKGLLQLMETISLVKQALNSNLNILGTLILNFDARKNTNIEIAEALKNIKEIKTLPIKIRTDSQVETSQARGIVLPYFTKHSKAVDDYREVAELILEGIKNE